MKYNYPIKYAAMPIMEQVGWSHGLNELEREYDVVCYIVSKCFLLSDKTKYQENGESEKEYEVVFPYQKGQYSWERVKPSSSNSCYVDKVFVSYKDALEYVKEKNHKLSTKIAFTSNLSKDYSTKIKEFKDKVHKYNLLEQQILTNTTDLDSSYQKKLDNIIIYNKGILKEINSNIYEYLNYSNYNNYIVYTLSLKEYKELLTIRDNKEIEDNILKKIPILYHNGKENPQVKLVINDNGKVLYYINKWESLIPYEKENLFFDLSMINEQCEYVFTTETLSDIVNSFKQAKNIDLNEGQKLVLKK